MMGDVHKQVTIRVTQDMLLSHQLKWLVVYPDPVAPVAYRSYKMVGGAAVVSVASVASVDSVN